LRDDAGTERGEDLGDVLFGAPDGARGARDEACGVGSTESMAAMRSACVMPDMSAVGIPGGADAPTARGAVDGVRDETAGASLLRGGAAETLLGAAGGAATSPLPLTDGAAFEAGVDSGVPSGARRTT
jgi:hypothetical protein